MDDSRTATRHTLVLTTMHCADCAALIDDTVRALPGVRTVHSSTATREVAVDLDPDQIDPATVTAAVTGLGFRLKPPPVKASAPGHADRPQVSDVAWRVLEPVLRSPGKQVRDVRQVFEGIAYKHRADVPWRQVPPAFGPWQTLYARYARWRADGTWTRLTSVVADSTDLATELSWLTSAV